MLVESSRLQHQSKQENKTEPDGAGSKGFGFIVKTGELQKKIQECLRVQDILDRWSVDHISGALNAVSDDRLVL